MEQLSTGVLNRVINGEAINDPMFLQIVGSKLLKGDKYRLWLSDGVMMTNFALALSNEMEFLENENLSKFSICKVNSYELGTLKNLVNSVIMVKNVEIVTSGEQIGNLIGNPYTYVPKGLNIKDQLPVVEEVRANPVNNNPESGQNETEIVRASQSSVYQNIYTVPLINLSPYYGKWIIRARVSAKSDIRTWSNARGEGKLFSLDLIDESGEIRCTGFNDQVDAFYDLFQIESIYYISKCQVKPVNKRYTTIKHEFELVLGAETSILRYEGEDLHIPMIQFDFCVISDIEFKENGYAVDILAILKNVGEVVKSTSQRSGVDFVKRNLLLVDDSNTMVTLTLWGAQAEAFSETEGTPLALKNVTVKEFNGDKSLSTVSSTIVQANPAIPDVDRIITWYNDTEKAKTAKMISNTISVSSSSLSWLNFLQVQEQNIGLQEKNNMFLTKAVIGSLNHQNCLYKACPSDNCNKKLLDPINGMYRCVKCNADFPNFTYKMIIQASLLDYTQELRVTIFNNEAEQILNKSAQEVGNIQENLSIDAYGDIFENCKLKYYNFKILMKQEHFNNISKVRAIVQSVTPVNFLDYSAHLLKEIKNTMEKPSA
ncbi:replication protein A 70 kDa DNA-binding subunit-like [Leptopilina heterotoma]|uniref:replication protein A 70 kDa DNA-binding subunit-like n=1 Tax=Leptopilina heterotoma TaxID=63436 RepID=UPI001CA80DD1|nr:replication protein A 70 kDa DNA-binding subunit-like [Leptopilina heterotoma]